MIYIINNVSVPLDAEADLHRMAIKALRCKPGDLISVRIYRRSVDARKKENIRLTFSLAAEVRDGCRVAASPFVHELKEEQPIFSKGEEPLDQLLALGLQASFAHWLWHARGIGLLYWSRVPPWKREQRM